MPKREETEDQSPGQYWHAQLEQAQKTFDKWETRAKKVVKRYRDERDAVEAIRRKFNILWSNIQVMSPALYGRAAKPDVSRRYMDQDPIGRLASTMLERTIDYEVNQFPDYDAAMRGCVEDRLLPGRGIAWVRFAPNMATMEPAESPEQEVAEEGAQITDKTEDQPLEYVDSAHSPVDYVYWCDFLHSPARTWEEVWWVARWVYMTKDEGIERFGDVFRNVPIDQEEPIHEWKDNSAKRAAIDKKAKVAEIWDKRTGNVCWVAKGYPQQLDEKRDPLQLEGFFPCPKPLYATTTNGSLIPIPDFCEYEDQANELDSITNRIALLVKAIKAVGVFNAEYKELSRLLNEGVDNKLFPVTAWAALAEKGGLKGAVDMLDITTQIKALEQLYVARDQCKQTIYEVMGISDIIRGSSDAGETLGAQKLKAQFGSLRLRNSQADVARFASDLFRIKAQIICKFYPPELIVEMSGIMNMPEGQDPNLVAEALQMLRDSTVRDFHIQVESDTLAQIDEQAEKEAAVEVTTAIGQFLKEALPVVQAAPEMLPLAGEMLTYTLRRFKAGRGLEGAVERAMQALQARLSQPNPQPNPEMVKIQAEQQSEQARIAAEQQAKLGELQHAKDLETVRQQAETNREQMRLEYETDKQWRTEKLKAETAVIVATINANAKAQTDAMNAQNEAARIQQDSEARANEAAMEGESRAQERAESLGQFSEMQQTIAKSLEAFQAAIEKIGAPRSVIRDASGRVAGIQ